MKLALIPKAFATGDQGFAATFAARRLSLGIGLMFRDQLANSWE
jgi:hypothetical protein